jgi:hypothetical protein
MRNTRKHVGLLLVLGLAAAAVGRSGTLAGHSRSRSQRPALTPSAASPHPHAPERYGKLPLYFIENRGQTDKRVAYYLPGSDKSLYFAADGVTWVLHGSRPKSAPGSAGVSPAPMWPRRPRSQDAPSMPKPSPDPPRLHTLSLANWQASGSRLQAPARQRWTLKLDFLGANHAVRPRGEQLTPATVSYFRGKREQWKTGLKTYTRVVYRNLWPGIDLVYRGSAGQLKYTFTVRPGADPQRIKRSVGSR